MLDEAGAARVDWVDVLSGVVALSDRPIRFWSLSALRCARLVRSSSSRLCSSSFQERSANAAFGTSGCIAVTVLLAMIGLALF